MDLFSSFFCQCSTVPSHRVFILSLLLVSYHSLIRYRLIVTWCGVLWIRVLSLLTITKSFPFGSYQRVEPNLFGHYYWLLAFFLSRSNTTTCICVKRTLSPLFLYDNMIGWYCKNTRFHLLLNTNRSRFRIRKSLTPRTYPPRLVWVWVDFVCVCPIHAPIFVHLFQLLYSSPTHIRWNYEMYLGSMLLFSFSSCPLCSRGNEFVCLLLFSMSILHKSKPLKNCYLP